MSLDIGICNFMHTIKSDLDYLNIAVGVVEIALNIFYDENNAHLYRSSSYKFNGFITQASNKVLRKVVIAHFLWELHQLC